MNIVIPINSNNFNIILLKQNLEIYKREGVTIYLSVMGAGIQHLKENLKYVDMDGVNITYDNNTFNYSYAINRIIRILDDDDIVIIGDFWVPVSLWQIEKDIKLIDLEENFLMVNVYKDDKNFGQPINLKSKKFMASLATRLSRMSNLKEDIPIIISKVGNIKTFINGLEESIPTSVARYLLKYKLEEFGYNKNISVKDTLNIQPMIYNLSIINDYISNDLIFIKSNLKNNNWGGDSPKSVPIKNKLNNSNVIKVNNIPKSHSKILPKKNKVLLLLNTDIKTIVNSSKILKHLKFNEDVDVDIITNNKESAVARLFPEYLFNHIYSIDDMSRNIIKFSQYNRILRYNSSIKLPKNIIAQDIDISHNFIPECNYIYPARSILPGTIFIANTQYNNINYKWDNITELIHKLINITPHVIIYNHPQENEICNKNLFNSYKNILNPNITNLKNVIGIMKQCSLVITNQNTDVFWLAYGANVPILLYEGPPSNLPKSKNITINNKRDCIKCDIDTCDNFNCLKSLDLNIMSSIIYDNI